MKTVECLIVRLTELKELHLTSNNYSTVSFEDDFKKESLRILYFNNNDLTEWNDVFKLGRCFPYLESLIIRENKLSDLNESNLIRRIFTQLKMVNLNKLNITRWETVEQFKNFQSLVNIRIQNIPLLNDYSTDEKHFLIVVNLNEHLIETLNGS